MIKEVEDIILTKQYFELTPQELEAVNEYAQNEEEFEDMKFFLLGAADVFKKEKIEARPELKKNVMAHLHESGPSKRIWLNSVGAFLFPTEKKMYQYPGLQIAAVAVIAFGLTFLFPDMSGTEDMALNKTNETRQEDDVQVDNLEDTISTSDGLEVGNRLVEESPSDIEDKDLESTTAPVFDMTIEEEPMEEEEFEMDEVVDLADFSPNVEQSELKPTTTLTEDTDNTESVMPQEKELDNSKDASGEGSRVDNNNNSGAIGGAIVETKTDNARDKDRFNKQDEKDKRKNAKKENEAFADDAVVDNFYYRDSAVTTGATSEPGVVSDEETFVTSEAGGKYEEDDKGYKIDHPDSYHIENSKELKSLFFTVK